MINALNHRVIRGNVCLQPGCKFLLQARCRLCDAAACMPSTVIGTYSAHMEQTKQKQALVATDESTVSSGQHSGRPQHALRPKHHRACSQTEPGAAKKFHFLSQCSLRSPSMLDNTADAVACGACLHVWRQRRVEGRAPWKWCMRRPLVGVAISNGLQVRSLQHEMIVASALCGMENLVRQQPAQKQDFIEPASAPLSAKSVQFHSA